MSEINAIDNSSNIREIKPQKKDSPAAKKSKPQEITDYYEHKESDFEKQIAKYSKDTLSYDFSQDNYTPEDVDNVCEGILSAYKNNDTGFKDYLDSIKSDFIDIIKKFHLQEQLDY